MSNKELEEAVDLFRELKRNREALEGIHKNDISIYTYACAVPIRVSDLLSEEQYESIVEKVEQYIHNNVVDLQIELNKVVPEEVVKRSGIQ